MAEDQIGKMRLTVGTFKSTLIQNAQKLSQPLITLFPNWELPINYAILSLGVLQVYQQEKINSYVEFLMANPALSQDELLNNQDFIEGLNIHIASYIRLRSEEKLKYAQNIFYNFATSEDKVNYPLERYDDTLEKLSDRGIQLLGFIAEEIPSIKKQYIATKIKEHGNDPEVADWDSVYGKESLEVYISFYIDNEVKNEVKEYKDHNLSEEEQRVRSRLVEAFSYPKAELVQLGLATEGSYSTGYGPGVITYSLNDFGEQFKNAIDPNLRKIGVTKTN